MEYQKQSPPATTPEIGVPVSSPPTSYYNKEERPVIRAKAAHHHGEWSTGLCDCFSDPKNCCITCWCPCITFGQVAEVVDKGSSSCGVNGALYTLIACVTGCSCLYSCFYRSKMREHYSLKGSHCNDCLVHCFCEYCALCQEYRELEHRGFDMSLGWHGNVEKQNKGIIMAPVVQQGMHK